MESGQTSHDDYHLNFTNKISLEWLENNLFPCLKKKSLIISDKAPTHTHLDLNEFNHFRANKDLLCEWLNKNNIKFGVCLLNQTIWQQN